MIQLLAALALPAAARGLLEVVGERGGLREHAGVVFRQRVLRRRGAACARPAAPAARRAAARSRRRRRAAAADPARGNSGSRALLPCCASPPCGRRRGIPQARLLPHASAVATRASICRSISYSSAFCRKRNELRFFTSALVPSFVSADGTHRDVGVAAQAALFHVAVVDAERDQDRAQPAEELGGRRRRIADRAR